MADYDIQHAITELLHERDGSAPRDLHIESERFRDGLEAMSVARIKANYEDRHARRRTFSCVAKQLCGPAKREASVYRCLLGVSGNKLLPEVFLIAQRPEEDFAVVFLEDLSGEARWLWRDVGATATVLRDLAAFHSASRSDHCLPAWNYEQELQRSAITTLDQLDEMHRISEWTSLISPGLRAARRLVASLQARRSALLRFGPFDDVIVHGDVHSGNVLVRQQAAPLEPVLIDWSRARTGSALEDVSSWLQSLAYWEPEARRRHDTLLKAYLSTRACVALSSDLRAAYWTAGASNALAGALRYHCWRATRSQCMETRRAASLCVRDWLRVIARADALSA